MNIPTTTGRLRNRHSVTMALSLALLMVAAPAYSITKDFSFDGCSWRSVADGWSGYWAHTKTIDMNGGCRYLDADLQYRQEGNISIKWCAAANEVERVCQKNADDKGLVFHDSSHSAAQSTETDRWQYSGWWG